MYKTTTKLVRSFQDLIHNNQHVLPQCKLFEASSPCNCYCGIVVDGGGYGDGGVAAQEFDDDDVVFQRL